MFILDMLMAGVLPRAAARLRGGHGAGPPPAAARPRHRQHQHLTPGGGGSNPRNCDQRATPWAQKPLIKLDVDQVVSVSLLILVPQSAVSHNHNITTLLSLYHPLSIHYLQSGGINNICC